MSIPTPKMCRFTNDTSGATAVEFALIAPVLMFMFMAILEVAIMFFVEANIDGAAIEAARRIRTGQTQSSGDAEGDFSSTLCAALSSSISCGDLFYDVQTSESFTAIDLTTEYDEDTGEPVTNGFSTGGAGDIVVVRVMYYWDFVTPLIGAYLSDSGSDRKLMVSAVVFQNEPYE